MDGEVITRPSDVWELDPEYERGEIANALLNHRKLEMAPEQGGNSTVIKSTYADGKKYYIVEIVEQPEESGGWGSSGQEKILEAHFKHSSSPRTSAAQDILEDFRLDQ